MKKYYKTILLSFLLFVIGKNSFGVLHIVNVEDNQFNPVILSVNVGDSIMWMWDHGHHTTTSTNIPNGAAAWDNPMDQNNTMFIYVITTAGSYDYECIYHASMGMTGHIEAAGSTGIANISGQSPYTILGNAVHDNITVAFNTAASNWNFQLLSITGELVKSYTVSKNASETESFNVSDLTPGIYILNVSDEKKTTSTRILKQ